MWQSAAVLILSSFASVVCENVKIGVASGPESDRRLNSDKFWSFSRNSSLSIVLQPVVIQIPYWSILEVGNAACEAAKKGVRALVVDSPPRLTPLVASYSDGLGLPLVSSRPGGGFMSHFSAGRNHFTLFPDATRAATDLIHALQWDSFAFFYDTDTGADQLQRIVRGLSPVPRVEGFWRTYSGEEAERFVNNLHGEESRVLLATTESVADDLFSRLATSNRVYHGILLTPVGTVRRISSNQGRSKLYKFSVLDEQSAELKELENRWKTLEEWTYPGSTKKELPDGALFLHDASKLLQLVLHQTGLERSDFLHKKIPDNIDCFNFTCGLPDSVNTARRNVVLIRGLSGDIQVNEEGQRTGYTLYIMETTSMATKKVGKWSDINGIQLSEGLTRDLPLLPRLSFRKSGPLVRVTSVLQGAFLKYNSSGELVGYVADFLNELSNVTGHKYQIQLVKDNGYGKEVNGKWNGMVGELVRKEADMVVADLTKTPQRAEVITFSKTFMTTGLNVLLLKPPLDKDTTTLRPFSFLTVWPLDLWAVIAVVTAVFAASGYAVSKFVGAPDRIRAIESKSKDNLSPCGSCWYTVASLLLRDAGIYPRTFTHRVWALIWWLFCFFVLVCYISSLTAALIQTRTSIVSTHSRKTSQEILQDALQKGYPTVGTITRGTTNRFFTESTIGLYRSIGRYLEENPDVLEPTYALGAERVRRSGGAYAYVMESASSDFLINTEPCDLIASSGYLTTRSYAPALPKDSDIKDDIDHGVLTLMERGTLRQLYEKWWHNFTSYCEDPNLDLLPKVYSSALTLYEISGVFYVLIAFFIVSIAVAFVEHYYMSKRLSLD